MKSEEIEGPEVPHKFEDPDDEEARVIFFEQSMAYPKNVKQKHQDASPEIYTTENMFSL